MTINIFRNIINYITMATKGLAMISLSFMVLFIGVQVLMRTMNSPIVGDYEIVELMMVVIISFGLAQAASKDAHISISLLVERLPLWMQTLSKVLAYILTMIVCLVIGITNINVAVDYITSNGRATQMLAIPLYPFKIAIGIGFCLWAFQALLKLLLLIFEKKDLKHKESVNKDHVSISG